MHRHQPRHNPPTLWQRWRDLFATQPAPAVWFDPRPNRRVRRNRWRRAATPVTKS